MPADADLALRRVDLVRDEARPTLRAV
jgi:hypothetical protein